MKKALCLLIIMLAGYLAQGRQITIAVIDTGYDSTWNKYKTYMPKKICGYYNGGETDWQHHGTAMVGTMAAYLNYNMVHYCLYIIKTYYDDDDVIAALKTAASLNPDVLNLSYSGRIYMKDECAIIKLMLKKNTIVVAAAGNDNVNTDAFPTYPSHCAENVIKVYNTNKNSNTFTIPSPYKIKENVHVITSLPGNRMGYSGGTSQAAALVSAKMATILYRMGP